MSNGNIDIDEEFLEEEINFETLGNNETDEEFLDEELDFEALESNETDEEFLGEDLDFGNLESNETDEGFIGEDLDFENLGNNESDEEFLEEEINFETLGNNESDEEFLEEEINFETLGNNETNEESLEEDINLETLVNSDSLTDDKSTDVSEDTNLLDTEESVDIKYNANGDIVVVRDDVEDLDFKVLPITDIIIPKRVRKVTQDSVKSMVRAIKTNGLLTPIVVTPILDGDNKGKYYLIDGYRRLLAYHMLGNKSIISVINPNIRDTHNLLVEALYNHNIKYDINEIIDYTKKLEDELGITNVNTIEYLLQMDIGDYTKLKDVLRDNDEDIIGKLLDGTLDIKGAYKKVEARRKKETREQQQDKLSQDVTNDSNYGVGTIGSLSHEGGDEYDNSELNDMNNTNKNISAGNLDEVDNMDLDEVLEESDNARLSKDNEQVSGNRECLDPSLRKAVLARDEYGCMVCKQIKGSAYVDVLDVHHILPVFLNKQQKGISKDNMDNLVTVCTVCHKLIHLDAQDKVHFDINDDTSELEKAKIKRIKMLSNVIKDGVKANGYTINDLKGLDKDIDKIGRSFGQVVD